MQDVKVWNNLQDRKSKIAYLIVVLGTLVGMIIYCVILAQRVQDATLVPTTKFSFVKTTPLKMPGLFICPFNERQTIKVWAEDQKDKDALRDMCTWNSGTTESYCPVQANQTIEIFPGENIKGCFVLNGAKSDVQAPTSGDITTMKNFEAKTLKDTLFSRFLLTEIVPVVAADDVYEVLQDFVFLGVFNQTTGPASASLSVIPYNQAIFSTIQVTVEKKLNGTANFLYGTSPISAKMRLAWAQGVSASIKAIATNPTEMIFRAENLFVTTSTEFPSYTAGDAFSALGGAWSYVSIVFGLLFTQAVIRKPKKKLRFLHTTKVVIESDELEEDDDKETKNETQEMTEIKTEQPNTDEPEAEKEAEKEPETLKGEKPQEMADIKVEDDKDEDEDDDDDEEEEEDDDKKDE
eukprot:TRINITY_DN88_c0_g1_i10.p1 TRINITY_DN88_c0_g1~~TRINITY_DN88_c0_g1_i10.p1  ORF type:complete len:407 (-),score=163.96 TRINITY_DN88_c0_g1_i10:22-1242(-)